VCDHTSAIGSILRSEFGRMAALAVGPESSVLVYERCSAGRTESKLSGKTILSFARPALCGTPARGSHRVAQQQNNSSITMSTLFCPVCENNRYPWSSFGLLFSIFQKDDVGMRSGALKTGRTLPGFNTGDLADTYRSRDKILRGTFVFLVDNGIPG
jgi:hypothetical protein